MTKSHTDGGFGLGRITSSLVIAAAMIVFIALTSLRYPDHGRPREADGVNVASDKAA